MADRLTIPQTASVRAPTIDIYAPQWRNFMFVAPFLFFFTTLLVFPLLWGMWLSFHKADTFSSGNFVGFGNYVRLFHDKVFLQSVWNTFYFVPAAYHRQVEPGTVSKFFVSLASVLIAVAMLPLMMGLCLEVYLVGHIILHDMRSSAIIAIVLFVIFVALWYGFPFVMSSRLRQKQ